MIASHWLRIIMRLPRQNAEVTLFALVALALSVVAICLSVR